MCFFGIAVTAANKDDGTFLWLDRAFYYPNIFEIKATILPIVLLIITL